MPLPARCVAAALVALALGGTVATAQALTVDDFESGLPYGTDGDGIEVGFITYSGGGPVSIGTTMEPPAPLPGAAPGNNVLQIDVDVDSFGGVVHNFENAGVDTWTTRDWSAFDRFGFWLYGSNSGTTLYIDLLDNRPPGSTTNNVEIFTVFFNDNFSGWQHVEMDFAAFSRRDVFPGAPDDGLGLTEVHGWAFGTLDTNGPQTFYLDRVQVVPEPGTWALMAAGLAAVAAARRRRA